MIVGISGYVGNRLTGIGRVLLEVLKELCLINRKDKYVLFKNYDFDYYAELEKESNIEIVDIRVSKNDSLKNIVWHQWQFQKLLKEYNCDIAYIPNFSLLIWKRIPTVVTIHDLIEFNVPNKFSKIRMIYRKIIDPMMVRNSDYVTTVSECSKRDIIKYCNVRDKEIRVIPNAADSNKFIKYPQDKVDEVLTPLGLKYKGYCLFVGTIDYPGKNLMTALKAFVNIKEKYRIPEKMVIVGKNGYNSEVIYEFVRSSEYMDDIIFTGYLPDKSLPLMYAGAEVMINLSLYEGFGLPVLEGMSCGTAVLCSNTSCFPEVYGNVDVGVSPHNVSEIEDKLYKLISDKDYNAYISNQCYERALSFSWKKSALEYYEVFNTLVSQKKTTK